MVAILATKEKSLFSWLFSRKIALAIAGLIILLLNARNESTTLPLPHSETIGKNYTTNNETDSPNPIPSPSPSPLWANCSIGTPPWKTALNSDAIRTNLDSFNKIWRSRPGGDNKGGGSFFHYFALYNIIQSIKPTSIIESGAWKGVGTWFLRQMSGNGTHIVVVSPDNPKIYVDNVVAGDDGRSSLSTYYTGSNFQDFNSINWTEIVDPTT